MRPILYRQNQNLVAGNQLQSVLKLMKRKDPGFHFVGTDARLDVLADLNPTFSLEHNRLNATIAVRAIQMLDPEFTFHQAIQELKNYQPPPYRCATRMSRDGRFLIINDSKATNVDATLAAIRSAPGPILLMLGGRAKKESFGPISDFSNKIHHILIWGESQSQISEEIDPAIGRTLVSSLRSFLSSGKLSTSCSSVRSVLFSPACASYDEFNSFMERGSYFDQFTSDL
jgi:UDP-N-acetylmuramoylalanine--D-glutamate ligase